MYFDVSFSILKDSASTLLIILVSTGDPVWLI